MKNISITDISRIRLLLESLLVVVIGLLFVVCIGCGKEQSLEAPGVEGPVETLGVDLQIPGFTEYQTPEEAFNVAGFQCRMAKWTMDESLEGVYVGPSSMKPLTDKSVISFHYQTFKTVAQRGSLPDFKHDMALFDEMAKAWPDQPRARSVQIAGREGILLPAIYQGDSRSEPVPAQVMWIDGDIFYGVVAGYMEVTADQLVKIAESMYDQTTGTSQPVP